MLGLRTRMNWTSRNSALASQRHCNRLEQRRADRFQAFLLPKLKAVSENTIHSLTRIIAEGQNICLLLEQEKEIMCHVGVAIFRTEKAMLGG